MTSEVHSAIAYMRDTAAAYREEAKTIFKRIEDCALLTEDVCKACETLKLRMENPFRALLRVVGRLSPPHRRHIYAAQGEQKR